MYVCMNVCMYAFFFLHNFNFFQRFNTLSPVRRRRERIVEREIVDVTSRIKLSIHDNELSRARTVLDRHQDAVLFPTPRGPSWGALGAPVGRSTLPGGGMGTHAHSPGGRHHHEMAYPPRGGAPAHETPASSLFGDPHRAPHRQGVLRQRSPSSFLVRPRQRARRP